MRTLCLPAFLLIVAALYGCDKQPTDGVSKSEQVESQMEMAGAVLRKESPRESAGGE